MSDIWSNWLRHRRFGGDEKYQSMALAHLKNIAINLVDKAHISESNIVLDVGAGDGIIGLTALERLGQKGKLILSDISDSALKIPKEIFDVQIRDSRVDFLVCSVENLNLPSDSIDKVFLRSVLLYVEKKENAFKEIYRVLKNGGIAVILDPINSRNVEFGKNFFRGYRLDDEPLLKVKSQLLKVANELTAHTPASFYNYNEHDLVHCCIECDFNEVRLDYSISHNTQDQHISFKSFFDVASNPYSPSLKESMKKVLSTEESILVENVLKEAIKQPTVRTYCEAILTLKK